VEMADKAETCRNRKISVFLICVLIGYIIGQGDTFNTVHCSVRNDLKFPKNKQHLIA
jgi:hypothetical protein